MVKTLLISAALIIIIALLIIIAIRPPALQTQPVGEPIRMPEDRGQPSERAPEIVLPAPSEREPEIEPLQPGIPAERVYPTEVHFWVNEIRVPHTTAYEEGFNFIPIKQSQLKTFAGSFGPFFEDPTHNIKVVLCSEFYKVTAAPACELVPVIYRGGYVSFAKGYQYDEYIGGLAAKDYIAYYTVYAGETPVGFSNKAVIRTVKD